MGKRERDGKRQEVGVGSAPHQQHAPQCTDGRRATIWRSPVLRELGRGLGLSSTVGGEDRPSWEALRLDLALSSLALLGSGHQEHNAAAHCAPELHPDPRTTRAF